VPVGAPTPAGAHRALSIGGRHMKVSNRTELYRSPNGDCWYLERDPANGHGIVIHEPNQSSGGRSSRMEIADFLLPGSDGPEHQALLRLTGSLAGSTTTR
jgi:hypothetical protein